MFSFNYMQISVNVCEDNRMSVTTVHNCVSFGQQKSVNKKYVHDCVSAAMCVKVKVKAVCIKHNVMALQRLDLAAD